jgi:hypothetical protein
MPACEAADHWQARVKVRGKGGAENTSVFALTKKEDLRKHLEGSPRARSGSSFRIS